MLSNDDSIKLSRAKAIMDHIKKTHKPYKYEISYPIISRMPWIDNPGIYIPEFFNPMPAIEIP